MISNIPITISAGFVTDTQCIIGLPQTRTITVGISVTLLEHYRGQQGQRLIMGWLLTLPVSGFFSGFLRPDDAYIDKKPMFKSKITQGIAHFLLSIPVSAIAGCILYAIVDTLLNSL